MKRTEQKYVNELKNALIEAKELIRTWHEIKFQRIKISSSPEEDEMWKIYNNSPEMKRINEALNAEMENDKPDFRTDIAEELSREQLIDRFCELNEAYQKLREKEFQRELDTIGNNKLMTAKEVLTKYSDGHYSQFNSWENILMAMNEYHNQFK